MLGTVGLATAVFFVDLYKPWYYFWMYCGVAMRLVLCAEENPATEAATPRLKRPTVRRDPYGWAHSGTGP